MMRMLAMRVAVAVCLATTAAAGVENSDAPSPASPAAVQTIGMVWIGDSNTKPSSLAEGETTFGRVVSDLVPALREINKGCPGSTTWDWVPARQKQHKRCYRNAALLKTYRAMERHADLSHFVVHIQLGLNDVEGIEEPACGDRPWLARRAGCRTSVEDFRRNLESLLADLMVRHPNAIFLLSTPPNPPMILNPEDRERLAGFRATVIALVNEHDAVCFGIDFYERIGPRHFGFGPHFDQETHRALGAALAERIGELDLVALLVAPDEPPSNAVISDQKSDAPPTAKRPALRVCNATPELSEAVSADR